MFECAVQLSDRCIGGDLFDPLYETEDGKPVCFHCRLLREDGGD